MAIVFLLIGYMFLFVHRPFEVWPVLGTFRIELLYLLVTIPACLFSGRLRLIPNSLHYAYAAFSMAVLGCWFLSPWWQLGSASFTVECYFKQLVFYVMLVMTVRSEREMKAVVLGFFFVMAIYMLHSAREFHAGRHEYRMGIVRMIGVDDMLGDPNSFSATIVYALPFVFPAWSCLRHSRARWLVPLYFALSAYCIIRTGSRGAFVGLLTFASLTLARSRRKLLGLLVLAPAAVVIWLIVPPELKTRFTTLVDPSVGPANARESAESRGEGLHLGLQLWQRFPLTGCGPGVWRPATGSVVESHNLYGQVVGEMGTIGLLTFGTIVALLAWNVHAVRRLYRAHPHWPRDFPHQLAGAIGMSLFLLLLVGYGAHSLFRYTWQWYGAFLIVARHLVEQRLWYPDPEIEPEGFETLEHPVGLGAGS